MIAIDVAAVISRSLRPEERLAERPLVDAARTLFGRIRARVMMPGGGGSRTADGGIFGRYKATRRGQAAGAPWRLYRSGGLHDALRARQPRPGLVTTTFRGSNQRGLAFARQAALLQFGIPGQRPGAGRALMEPSQAETDEAVKALAEIFTAQALTESTERATAWATRRVAASKTPEAIRRKGELDRKRAEAASARRRSNLEALGIRVDA